MVYVFVGLEFIIARFMVHGFALGAVIGFIDAWNEKVMAVLFIAYFILVIISASMVSTEQFAQAAVPSIGAVVAQVVGAALGFVSGKHSFKSAFANR